MLTWMVTSMSWWWMSLALLSVGLVQFTLDRRQWEIIIVVVNQVVDFKLQHAFPLVVRHACNYASWVNIHNSILVGASLRSELDVSSLCSDLLVESVSDFAIDLIQILVGQADMSDRAIWVHESVINDSSSKRCLLLPHASCLLLAHLRVGLSLLL